MNDNTFSAEPINWNLLQTFHNKPHPAINVEYVERAKRIAEDHGLPYFGEIVQEYQAAHHLLDMLGVPCPHPIIGGAGHPSDLDARVWRAINGALALTERLDRIAKRHIRETADGGMVGDLCIECEHKWPCDTRRMAEGQYEDDE